MELSPATPILRSFDETKAREFYVDFLGFKIDWEHRFEPGMPLYMQVSQGGCILHLSEHFGDCSPGSGLRIGTSDVDAYQAELLAKNYKHARPGVEQTSWGTREMTIQDPAGNRLVFWSPATKAAAQG